MSDKAVRRIRKILIAALSIVPGVMGEGDKNLTNLEISEI